MSPRNALYAVGHIYPEWVGEPDGVRVSVKSGLVEVEVLYNKPTAGEIAPTMATEPLEVRFTPVSPALGFFSFRFGKEGWTDAPFAPALYRHGGPAPENDPLELIESGVGFALVLMVIDTSTGRLVNLRPVGLGSDFSRFFANFYDASTPVEQTEYVHDVDAAYRRFTPKDLADLAPAEGRWALPGLAR